MPLALVLLKRGRGRRVVSLILMRWGICLESIETTTYVVFACQQEEF